MYEIYFNSTGAGTYDFPETDESAFWEMAGRALFLNQIPDGEVLIRNTNDHERCASIFVENGNLKAGVNRLRLKRSRYEVKKLRKVVAETNTHEFYDIIPNNMGKITIDVGGHYGKIGEKGMRYLEEGNVLRNPYPAWLYWPKYWQKILVDEYDDMTDLIFEEDSLIDDMFKMPEELAVDGTEEPDDVRLFEKLNDLARSALSDFNIDFMSNKAPFNAKQIQSSWKLYDALTEAATAQEANLIIAKMIAVMNPDFSKKDGKKVTVNSFMVKPSNDPEEEKDRILQAVLDAEVRIHAMEAVSQAVRKTKKKIESPFGDVEVRKASEEEREHVLNDLIRHAEYKDMVTEVYACHANEQSEIFDKYCEKRNIKETQELFHGSRTENFISIITNSLTSRVKTAHGTMYGKGIYFANEFAKSQGYTSYYNSRWANGAQNTGYIAVFEVAYGNALDPETPGVTYDNYKDTWMDANGYDCIHAHFGGGTGLRMDEIIVFHDEACRIKYLIEFGNKEEEDE